MALPIGLVVALAILSLAVAAPSGTTGHLAPAASGPQPALCGGNLSISAVASPDNGTAPLTVHFSSTVTGGCPPYEVNWEFGDVGEAESMNATHTFQGAGTYSILVTVRDSYNQSASRELTVVVRGGSGALTVAVQALPAAGPAPLLVTFWANVTGGNSTVNHATSWAFGDGGSGAGSPVSHSYAASGSYRVVATVSTSTGAEANASTTVVVSPGGTSTGPNLSLSADPAQGSAPLLSTIQVYSNGLAAPDALKLCYGDGSLCSAGPGGWNGSSPLRYDHEYAAPGNYSVVATLSDPNGVVLAGATTAVTVLRAPPLSVSGSSHPLGGSTPLTVQFTAQVSGGTPPYAIQWRFGDGSSGSSLSGSSVDHTYPGGGSYRATVIVRDSVGHTVESVLAPVTVEASATLFGLPSEVNGIPMAEFVAFLVLTAAAISGAALYLLTRHRRTQLRKEGEQLVRGMQEAR